MGTHAMAGHPPRPRVRALSFHARYACGHSGQCCSAGWPIPVEAHILPVLDQAITEQRTLATSHDAAPLTYPADRPASIGAVLGRTRDGVCVFFERAQRDGCCRVQRQVGVAALPIACRQFPRVARHDARGTDVTLSHWCPTALASLGAPGVTTVVEAPPAFPMAAEFEGLDARAAWPPLLRPGCLIDIDTYEAIERHAVAVLTTPDGLVESRVATLATWFDRLRTWEPRQGTLADIVAATLPATGSNVPDVRTAAGATAHPTAAGHQAASLRQRRLWNAVLEAIPAAARSRVPEGIDAAAPDAPDILASPAAQHQLGRYLAARFFGSWVAYQGEGLRSTLAGVQATLVVLGHTLALPGRGTLDERVARAIRTADLLLVHLASAEALAGHYRGFEGEP